jgi:dihydrofolate reductase
MQPLVVTTFVSIDGVMQGPGAPDEDRSGGFDLGGWLVPSMDEVVAEFAAEWIQLAGGILLGRRTYQMLAGYWPHVTDPADVLARHLNTLPKFVVSRTLERAGWANTTVLRGDLRAEVARLKATGHGELQLHGSLNVASQLIAAGLVDEYRLWTFPVVLGRGMRLFADGSPAVRLRLTQSRTSPSGVVVNTYQPAGPVTVGAFIPAGHD